jgi:hypothetical protein
MGGEKLAGLRTFPHLPRDVLASGERTPLTVEMVREREMGDHSSRQGKV